MHLGSWRLNPLEGNRSLTYRELADELAAYVTELGFTHVELLPVMEHPFSGSWGYQVTRLLRADLALRHARRLPAASSTGCTRPGIGVILDWVPAHFPRDDLALARFDGTALYEHADPRRGAHPTGARSSSTTAASRCATSSSRTRSSGCASFHADGLRVDAVASMLYLDYSRAPGRVGPEPRTAATRTSRRSRSCAS